MTKRTGPTNPLTERLIRDLRDREEDIWGDVADRLERPRRQRAEVNLSQLSRNASDGETVLVPGKVLGAGSLDEEIHVVALEFSGAARRKIVDAGGRATGIRELLEENPEGEDVKLVE